MNFLRAESVDESQKSACRYQRSPQIRDRRHQPSSSKESETRSPQIALVKNDQIKLI